MAEPIKKTADNEDTKLLGAKVPLYVFWKFKQAAAERQEKMEEAILNAALLYIDIKPETEPRGGK